MTDLPADGPPPTNLSRQTLSGLAWVYLSTGAGLVMQLAYTALMSRLLDPLEFGLVASAQVVLRFGKYASELGLGPALVQRATLTDAEIRAGFTSSAVLGAVLAAAMIAVAPALELFFDSPDVVPVLRVLALTLLINTLSIVPLSLLSREMRFRALAVVELASFAVGYLVVGIGAALLGFGVWSLVAATVTQLSLLGIGAYALTRHPVRPTLAFGRVAPLYSFGGKVSVITLMEYTISVAPSAFVGRDSGITALGQFNRASLLVDLPLVNLTTGLSRVLFPALSRVQHEIHRARGAYASAMRITGGLMAPLAAGLAAAAPEVVRLVLGPQWDTAAALVPPLAAAATLAFLAHYGGIVCEALDVLGRKVLLTAAQLVLIVGGLALAPTGDLMAYAWVLAGAQGAAAVAYGLLMARVLRIPARDHIGIYLPTALAAGAVYGAILGATHALRAAGTPVAVTVLCQVLVGAVVLLGLLRWGPLRTVRADVLQRLAHAGVSPSSPALRLVLRALGGGPDGRPPPS